jgi:hypothetical protein
MQSIAAAHISLEGALEAWCQAVSHMRHESSLHKALQPAMYTSAKIESSGALAYQMRRTAFLNSTSEIPSRLRAASNLTPDPAPMVPQLTPSSDDSATSDALLA